MYKVQVWTVYGNYGNGKTLLLTYLGLLLNQFYSQVCANFQIKGIKNFKYIRDFNVYSFRQLEKGSLILYSEAYKRLDCRESHKKENIEYTHEFQQLRKRGFNLIYDMERPQLIDLRLRRITNQFIKAYGNMYDILKSERSIKAQIEPIAFVKSVIRHRSFWAEHELEDLNYLYVYENMYYDYVSDYDCSTGKFFVLDGRKYFDKYTSEELINEGLKLWT